MSEAVVCDAPRQTNPAIGIKISDNYASIQITNSDGSIVTKNVTLENLCAAISRINIKTDMFVPRNCRAVWVRGSSSYYLFIRPGFVDRYVTKWDGPKNEYLECTPSENEMGADVSSRNLLNYRVFHIPYPATATLVCVQKRADGINGDRFYYKKIWLWALENENILLKDMSACYWPFANVFDDFHCCTGDLQACVDSVDALEYYATCMFTGIANSDLLNNGHFKQQVAALDKEINYPMQFMAQLNGMAHYPTKCLVKCGKLLNIVENIVGNHRD